MMDIYARLGFALTDPVPLMGEKDGIEMSLGQNSAHIIFADSYVELSAVNSSDPRHHLVPFLSRYQGLHILALSTDDAAQSNKALTAQERITSPLQVASRHVHYGIRHGEARFKWFRAPDKLSTEGFVCLVEQVTPDLVFQPPKSGHPNGSVGVGGVLVLSHNTSEAVQRFATFPGTRIIDGNNVSFGHQKLSFFNDYEFRKSFTEMSDIHAPALAGYAVRVANIITTGKWLQEHGIAIHEKDGGLWVGPEFGCGALVFFEPA